jgi:hypothetical protein
MMTVWLHVVGDDTLLECPLSTGFDTVKSEGKARSGNGVEVGSFLHAI